MVYYGNSPLYGNRRGWDPINTLGSALVDIFDFEDVSTLSLTGNQINSITGKKSGLALVQATSASKPLYMPTGMNGRPCAEFDGTDDGLVSSGTYTYVTGSAPLEIWALVNQKAPGSDTNIRTSFSLSGTANSARRARRSQNSGISRAQALIGSGATSIGVQNATEVFDGIHTARYIFGSTETSVQVNSVSGSPTAIVPATAGGQVGIGTTLVANQPWLGSINCVLLIDPTKPEWTETNKQKLLEYLEARKNFAGFKPEHLGDALLDIFDFEDTSSLSLTGSTINSITAKKTGYVLAQSTSASKPTYNATGFNNRPCAIFDGIDDTLLRSGAITYPSGASGSEIWVLGKDESVYPDAGGERFSFGYGTSSAVTSRRVSTVNNGTALVRNGSCTTGDGTNALSQWSSSNPPATVNHINRSEFTGTVSRCSLNGGTKGERSAVPATGSSWISIGSGNNSTNYWKGPINSIYIINPTHINWNEQSQQLLMNYLKTRGGIA